MIRSLGQVQHITPSKVDLRVRGYEIYNKEAANLVNGYMAKILEIYVLFICII